MDDYPKSYRDYYHSPSRSYKVAVYLNAVKTYPYQYKDETYEKQER
jgi:hypothetical protein